MTIVVRSRAVIPFVRDLMILLIWPELALAFLAAALYSWILLSLQLAQPAENQGFLYNLLIGFVCQACFNLKPRPL